MILRTANIHLLSDLKPGAAITVYRAGQHFVGYGTLQEISGSDITIQLDKEASDRYSDLQGREIPFEFEVREYTSDIQSII